MTNLTDIYSDVSNVGASIFPYPIGFTDAATIELHGNYAIMFDPDKFSTIRSLKWALAHEVGHCATGCTHKISSQWDIVERHEHKANRWAYEHYLPPEQIQYALDHGYTEPWQLAEWFDLPQNDIENALYYYINQRQITFDVAI